MATRIVHVSDLHFPSRTQGQSLALLQSINALRPDITVVSGDLTRSGRHEEFAEAAVFVQELTGQKLVVPGNHDIPNSFERFTAPFRRFDTYFSGYPARAETADVLILGFNSAAPLNFGIDWSLGIISSKIVAPVATDFIANRGNRLGVAVCHHPLKAHAMDLQRSRTKGGPQAFARLAAAGMDLLLHGHLHRNSCTCQTSALGRICELCANTALSDRERDGRAGFNVVEVSGRRWKYHTISYDGRNYAV